MLLLIKWRLFRFRQILFTDFLLMLRLKEKILSKEFYLLKKTLTISNSLKSHPLKKTYDWKSQAKSFKCTLIEITFIFHVCNFVIIIDKTWILRRIAHHFPANAEPMLTRNYIMNIFFQHRNARSKWEIMFSVTKFQSSVTGDRGSTKTAQN